MNYTTTLSDAEDKALSYVALSQQTWIDNAIKDRCRKAIDKIATIYIEAKLAAGETISGTKEEMVVAAFNEGIVITAEAQNALGFGGE